MRWKRSNTFSRNEDRQSLSRFVSYHVRDFLLGKTVSFQWQFFSFSSRHFRESFFTEIASFFQEQKILCYHSVMFCQSTFSWSFFSIFNLCLSHFFLSSLNHIFPLYFYLILKTFASLPIVFFLYFSEFIIDPHSYSSFYFSFSLFIFG